jgi:Triose-phosphate Transporter family
MTLLDEMAPIAAAMLFVSTLSIEQVAPFRQAIQLGRSSSAFILMLTCNSLLAYVVNVLNFALTQQTSPLTLQVLGNAKSVATSAASVAVFRNQISPLSAIGFFVSVAGTLAYGMSKRPLKVRTSPAKSTLFSKSSGTVSSLV